MTYFVPELSAATVFEAEPFTCPKARETRYSRAKMCADSLRGVFGRHAFEPNSRERCILITINSTIFVTPWNVMDRRGFSCLGGGGGERQKGQVEPI